MILNTPTIRLISDRSGDGNLRCCSRINTMSLIRRGRVNQSGWIIGIKRSTSLLRPRILFRVGRFLRNGILLIARRSLKIFILPKMCADQYALLFKHGGSDFAGRHFHGSGSSGSGSMVGVRVPYATYSGSRPSSDTVTIRFDGAKDLQHPLE